MHKKYYTLLISFVFLAFNIKAQIEVSFVANQSAGCPNPFLALVNDNSVSSEGNIISHQWQITGPTGFMPFSSTNESLAVPLNIPGFYNITLTVCDDASPQNCDTRTETNFIEVYNVPEFSFNFSNTVGCSPFEVCFDGVIDPVCGSIQSSAFDLRDGTVLTNNLIDNTSFCHTYNSPGNYTNFTVTITNSCGCSTTEIYTEGIEVLNVPEASFTSVETSSCTTPFTTTIESNSTSSSNAVLTWSIPQLGIFDFAGESITETFDIGSYDVQLIVTEPSGCADTLLVNNFINVFNPEANFSFNENEICMGDQVEFTDISNGNPSSWTWDIPGVGVFNNENINVNFPNAGTFDVSLSVTYPNGCDADILMSDLITVNENPTNSFNVDNESGCILPLTSTFTSTSTNSIQTNWEFQGGSPTAFQGAGPVDVVYTSAGNYNVIMTDSSANGCTSTTTFNSVVEIEELEATILSSFTTGCIPHEVNFDFDINLSENVTNISWNLPGSDILNTSTATPSATYNTVGCFNVTLSIETENGCFFTIKEEDFVCVQEPPTASFTLTPEVICYGDEEICFTYTGVGADSLFWDFGDGTLMPSIEPFSSVCHDYVELGFFDVSLIAFSGGCASPIEIIEDAVQILAPIAGLSETFNCENQFLRFFQDNSEEADSVFWNFGDPNALGADTSSLLNPSWEYAELGNYTVTIQAFNFSTGCEDEATLNLSIFDPEADFTASDTVVCVGDPINFSNISQFRGGSNGTRWDWDLYNGLTFPNSPATRGHNRSHTYNTPGIYSVSMRNRDPNGCMDTVTKLDYIHVHGIVGGFSVNQTEGCLPLSVEFQDTSSAPLSYIVSWNWDFGDGNVSTEQNPTYEYTSAGNFNVTLTMQDSLGCEHVVTYNNFINVQDPFANFEVDFDFVCTNQGVNISDQSLGNNLSHFWTFTEANILNYDVDNAPPPIEFLAEGTQTISLLIEDNLGCTNDTSLEITVLNIVVDGVADVNYAPCSNPPTVVNFTNLSYNNVDSTSVFWDFGNGLTSTSFNASTTYTLAGIYPVSLTVNSLSGCSRTAFVDTIVIEGPYGEITLLDSVNTACACSEFRYELRTVNSTIPVFLPGDGGSVMLTPMENAGDTIVDTVTYTYCEVGTFVPSLFLQDGTCSANILGDDTVTIDNLEVDFSLSSLYLCESGEVCFTDLSSNETLGTDAVISWEWDFGDGTTSSAQNPCHFFSTPGDYTIQLIVENSYGCIDTSINQVYVLEAPQVNFVPSELTGCDNLDVNFTDLTVVDPIAEIFTWSWDFGDGNTSSTQNPDNFYNQIGVFDITLEVSDNFGCVGNSMTSIEVFPLPNVQASNDSILCLGDSIQLLASGAQDYLWTPSFMISDDNISNPFVFNNVDTTYTVLGIDENGCENTDEVFIQVNSVHSNFEFNDVCASFSTSFTDLSTSIGGTIDNWNWSFNDLNNAPNDNAQDINPDYIFSEAGIYEVVLNVEDDFGCQDDTSQMILIQIPPSANFVADSVCQGNFTTFNSNNSLSGDGNIISWFWEFDSNGATSSDENPTFLYDAPGVYNVCLTVTTDLSCEQNSSQICNEVIVYDELIADFEMDNVCLGSPVEFQNTSIQSNGDLESVIWNFGQGEEPPQTFTTLENVSFIYNNYGIYTVSLNLTDANGCTSSIQNEVQVYDNPSANFNAETICESTTFFFESTAEMGEDSINNLENYQWSFNEGATFFNLTSNTEYLFNNLGMQNIIHVVIDEFGCTDTSNLNILVNPVVEANISASDTIICAGDSIELNALLSVVGEDSTFTWDFDFNSGIDAVGSEITFFPENTTIVALFVSDGDGCVDTATQQIVRLENPIAQFESEPACEQIEFSLTSMSENGSLPIIDYNWTINENETLFGNNVNYTHNVGNDSVLVQLHVNDSFGCQDSIEEMIYIEEQPFLEVLQANYYLCLGESIEISVSDENLFNTNGIASLNWSPNVGTENTLDETVTISPNVTTLYNIEAFGLNNVCPSDDNNQIRISVLTPPTINISATPNPVLSGSESAITVDVSPFNASTDELIWTDTSNTLYPLFGGNVVASPLTQTTYDVLLNYAIDSFICQLDTSITIDVINQCDGDIVYKPNIFTPNNDGQNDVFRFSGYGIDRVNKLTVFDRWGKVMYDASNIEMINGRMQGGWDGRNINGVPVNSGVYVYMYEAVCVNGGTITESGNVTLVK